MPPSRGFDIPLRRLVRRTLLYLGLPHAIFFATWLKLPFAIGLGVCLIVGIYLSMRTTQRIAISLPSKWNYRFLILVSPLFALGIGIGMGQWLTPHMHYLWHNHLWQDLVRLPWPIRYEDGQMLVHSIGYFLPSAWAGKMLHPIIQIIVEFWWGIYGISLVILWLGATFPQKTYRAIGIFMLFGGAEIIGRWLLGHTLWDVSWEPLAEGQISSIFPSVYDRFAVWPGQSLAAFFLATLFYHQWKDRLSIEACLMGWGMSFLWSWWMALGALPLLVFVVWHTATQKWTLWVVGTVSCTLAIVVMAFAWPQIQSLPTAPTSYLQVALWLALLLVLPIQLLIMYKTQLKEKIWWIRMIGIVPGVSLLLTSAIGLNVEIVIALGAVPFFLLTYEIMDALLSIQKSEMWLQLCLNVLVLIGMIMPAYHLYRQIHLTSYPHLQAYDPNPLSSLDLSQIPVIYMMKDLPQDMDRSPYYLAPYEGFFFEAIAKELPPGKKMDSGKP
ncbi:MAG: hypothetical protein AAF135_20325 [Bacteroidota bacterium]